MTVVYVETNFLLELALLHKGHEDCRSLLRLANDGTATEIVLPAFCVGEAFDAFERKRRERVKLADRLRDEVGQLSRSKTYAARRKDFAEMTDLFRQSADEQRRRLDRVVDEVLGVARLLPLGRAITREAAQLRTTRDLGAQDALVYASIVADLDAAAPPESCFITLNSKDFANPDIRDTDLAGRNCTLITDFADGYGHAKAAHGAAAP